MDIFAWRGEARPVVACVGALPFWSFENTLLRACIAWTFPLVALRLLHSFSPDFHKLSFVLYFLDFGEMRFQWIGIAKFVNMVSMTLTW